MVVNQKMKSSTEAALIVTGILSAFIIVPALIIFYYDLLLLITAISLLAISFILVIYYCYIDIKKEIEFKKYEFDFVTERFKGDPEKLRWYKFFREFLG
jgi:hypothetical protein